MGPGPESDPPVSLTTPEAPPSSAPVNLHCVTLSADAIQLTWAHPTVANHHGHLQGFRIFYKMFSGNNRHRIVLADEVSSFLRPESKKVGPNVLDSVLYGLQAYQNYSIQIAALNRAGSGPMSVPVVCQTDETGKRIQFEYSICLKLIFISFQVPVSVHEVKAVSVSSTSILVTWRRPTPPSGRIAHYVIQIKDTMTQDVVRFIKFQNLEFVFFIHSKTFDQQTRFMQHETENTLEHQIGQLVENRLYEISVTAKGRAGESRPSKTLTISPVAKSKLNNSSFYLHSEITNMEN
jgi:hypothetical protein